MTDISIHSLSDFIENIEKLRNNYPTGIIVNNPVVNPFVYRGLSDCTYELLPSVFRNKVTDLGETKIKNPKYLSWIMEEPLLKAFIQEASGYINLPASEFE